MLKPEQLKKELAMFKYLVCLFFLMLAGCASTSPRRPLPTMSMAPTKAEIVAEAQDDLKICSQAASAQNRNAEEIADCVQLYGYLLDQRLGAK